MDSEHFGKSIIGKNLKYYWSKIKFLLFGEFSEHYIFSCPFKQLYFFLLAASTAFGDKESEDEERQDDCAPPEDLKKVIQS